MRSRSSCCQVQGCKAASPFFAPDIPPYIAQAQKNATQLQNEVLYPAKVGDFSPGLAYGLMSNSREGVQRTAVQGYNGAAVQRDQ